MPYKTDRKFNKTALENNATYIDFYERMLLLAITRIEWLNLPDSVNARFAELKTHTLGNTVFVKDPELGYMILPVTPSGQLNVYEEPIAYTAFSINYNKVFKESECVLIRNNYLSRPTTWTLNLFAQRLYNVERSADVNVRLQKFPLIIRCDEKSLLTMKNMYMQVDGDYPYIFARNNVAMGDIEVMETNVPYIADKLNEYKAKIWDEFLDFLGLKNANTDKKERLIKDEVNANNELVNMNAEVMLQSRKLACKKINKLYGLNVDVRLRSVEEQLDYLRREGESGYGEIYDTVKNAD